MLSMKTDAAEAVRIVKSLVALLRIRHVDLFQCDDLLLRRPNQTFRFQRLPHGIVHLANLGPRLRDNDSGLALAREFEVVGRQPLLLLTRAALDDRATLLKPIK